MLGVCGRSRKESRFPKDGWRGMVGFRTPSCLSWNLPTWLGGCMKLPEPYLEPAGLSGRPVCGLPVSAAKEADLDPSLVVGDRSSSSTECNRRRDWNCSACSGPRYWERRTVRRFSYLYRSCQHKRKRHRSAFEYFFS